MLYINNSTYSVNKIIGQHGCFVNGQVIRSQIPWAYVDAGNDAKSNRYSLTDI
jgi:hypothetical protein